MRRRCSSTQGAKRLARWSILSAVATLAGVGCALSVPQERQLAERFDREMKQQYRFVNDPVVDQYVDQIGHGLVSAAGPQPFSYQFTVVDDPEINAFTGPAGHVYVHTGTILAARNASELAGVIAHEVGHVVNRHVAENYGRQQAASIGRDVLVLGAGVLGGGTAAGAANVLGGLGLAAALNTFGREAEREADDFAVQVLPRAGFDPHGLPSFFETLIAEGGPSVPTFLASHPAPRERLATTRRAIATLALPPGLRVDDGGRLEIIQQRVRLLSPPTPRRRWR
jgi:predicted Zn-dependent protease